MDLLESASKWLVESDPARMAHGTDFPIELIDYYLQRDPNLFVWDMGCGNTGRKLAQLTEYRYHPTGIDLSRRATETVNMMGLFARWQDITRVVGDEYPFDFITWLERVDGMVCEGLFPSLLGNNWQSALDAMDMLLRPGSPSNNSGYLFIADVLRGDLSYPEIEGNKGVEWEWRQYLWKKRLERNHMAFHGELPYGSFMVGAVGKHKNWLDWEAGPDQLKFVYDHREEPVFTDFYERMARHVDWIEFDRYMVKQLGYKRISMSLTSWKSRGGEGNPVPDLPGFLAVYRKPEIFRYHPWYQGFPVDPAIIRLDHAERVKPSPASLDYGQYFQSLLQYCPASQRGVIAAFEKYVNGD